MRFFRLLILALLLTAAARADQEDILRRYSADTIVDARLLDFRVRRASDSLMSRYSMSAARPTVSAITHRVQGKELSNDFYFLLLLVLCLGLVRMNSPRYFSSLLRIFLHPMRSSRQLNEQMQTAQLQNFFMNLFFAVVAGAYLYYIIKGLGALPERVHPFLVLPGLVLAVGIVYVIKYLVISITGWAFRIHALTEQYLFNVFLVNKILSLLLLPFVILLAFGSPQWAGPAAIVSLVVLGVMILNRYIRSWQVFGSLFQYSRFHFFTYLCASELLPLAVLIKLVIRGLF